MPFQQPLQPAPVPAGGVLCPPPIGGKPAGLSSASGTQNFKFWMSPGCLYEFQPKSFKNSNLGKNQLIN